MKPFIFSFLFVFISTFCSSQSIYFSPLSWSEALKKARSEHKILFVEIYTTWCTYCKQMEHDVFTKIEVGNFYNDHFINVRYDAQQNDGIQIRRSYAMLGFPTFLYLDGDGLVILKTAGFQEANRFLSNGDSAVLIGARSKDNMNLRFPINQFSTSPKLK